MWDIWSHIAKYIKKDKDKCRLMMTCKEISKNKFYFNEQILVKKIYNSRWFDNFVKIFVSLLPHEKKNIKNSVIIDLFNLLFV